MALDHHQVEQAIAGIAGVATASVRPSDSGRARLRITLRPGGDADAVAVAVSGVLRDRFGLDVDPAAIRPRPAGEDAPATFNGEAAPSADASPAPSAEPAAEPVTTAVADEPVAAAPDAEPEFPEAHDTDLPPAPPSDPPAPAPVAAEPAPAPEPQANGRAAPNGQLDDPRPVIRDLLVTEEGLGVRARVVLTSEGQELAGEATAAKTHKATLRAVARAALTAVEGLLGDQARLELESLQVTDDGEDQQIVVSVTIVTRNGAEKLVGGAVIRGDDETAALRAALDAINRRVLHLKTG